VRREINIYEGGLYSNEELEESINKLKRLGFFSAVLAFRVLPVPRKFFSSMPTLKEEPVLLELDMYNNSG
jgi:hypothetical protein